MTLYLSSDDKQAYMDYFAGMDSIWVFGYGSLIWNPGFEVAAQKLSCLQGFHREFCLISTHYRGTADCTGLVLALDNGGECSGLALEARGEQVALATSHLWDREMVTYAYLPVIVDIETADGMVSALTFVMNCNHEQYAGKLDDEAILERILIAKGKGGSNVDYLLQTAKHLKTWNIRDSHIEELYGKLIARLSFPQ